MAWLPTTLFKEIDIVPCLVCGQDTHGFSKVSAGQKTEPEVIKVICHIVHVNWKALWDELDGEYPTCHSCYKVMLDLVNISEELQLVENQLRSKVQEIQKIVVNHVGGTESARPHSHRQLVPGSSRSPHNSFQIHFIEEFRNWQLMRQKVEQSNSPLLVVDPSFVQLHLDVRHGVRVINRNTTATPCLTRKDPVTQPIIQRLRRRKSQINNGLSEEILVDIDIPTDEMHDKVPMDCGTNDRDLDPTQLVDVNMTTGHAEGEGEKHDDEDSDYAPREDGDSSEDLSDDDNDEQDDSDAGGLRTRTRSANRKYIKKASKQTTSTSQSRSMIALREPWKMERKGGRVYFKGIEIIKKPALPPQDKDFKYVLECGSCGKEIGQPLTGTPSANSRYCNMKLHIRAMHFGTYRCEPCQKDFSCPKALKYHLRSLLHNRRHGTDLIKNATKLPNGVTTDDEGRIFYKEMEIVKTNYEAKDGFDLKCSRCEKVVSSDEGKRLRRCPYRILINHLTAHHTEAHKCRMCGKQYTEPRNLESHFLFHHTVNPPKVECDICGRPLQTLINLRKHKWMHRNEEEKAAAFAAGEKPPVTYKEFVQRRRTRLGLSEAEFQCAECGKTFELMCQLKRHETTHTAKNYECALCGDAFSTYLQRFEHSKSVHNSKKVRKKYNCKLCPKSFKNRSEVQKHEKAHIDVMPFMCPACFSGFALQDSLRKHLKRCPEGRKMVEQNSVVIVTSSDIPTRDIVQK